MFLHLSVILFTGGSGRHPRADTPRQKPSWADTPLGRHPPGDGHCSGRYASYCNAFLFVIWLAMPTTFGIHESLCNLKGNLTQRHKEIFYKNPLFVGMRLPEVREVGSVEKKFPRISPLALDLMKVFINQTKYCSLPVFVAGKGGCSFSKT